MTRKPNDQGTEILTMRWTIKNNKKIFKKVKKLYSKNYPITIDCINNLLKKLKDKNIQAHLAAREGDVATMKADAATLKPILQSAVRS